MLHERIAIASHELGRYPLVASLAVTIVFTALAQNGLQTVWVYYTGWRYGWDTLAVGLSLAAVGLSLAAVGLSAAIVQGGLMGVILARFGEQRSVIFGLALAALSSLLYGLAPKGWMIYVILLVGGLGGIAGPAAQGLISRSVSDNEQGAVQGALSGVQTLTGVFGPLVATTLFNYFAPRGIPGASFFAGALLIGIGLLLALRTFSRFPQVSNFKPNTGTMGDT